MGALSGVASEGATYYVSVTGRDLDSGSLGQPWRTIQKAASTLQAGDVVFVRAGVYRERVVALRSGLPGKQIVYAAYPGEVVTLEGSGIEMPDDLAGLFEISGVSQIQVSGFRIVNAGIHSDNAGIMVQDAGFITIDNNYTSNTFSSGIGVWNCDHIDLLDNTTDLAGVGGWQEGITVAGTDTFEVRGNTVLNCRKEGICVKHGSHNGRISRNLVDRAKAVGIYVDAWDTKTFNLEVCGNTARNCEENGFALASEMGGSLENVRVHSNLAYDNRFLGLVVSINGPGGPQGQHPMDGIYVLNNTCSSNGWQNWGGGIAVDNKDARNVLVCNNICSQNLYFQLAVGSDVASLNVSIHHNLIDGFRGNEGEIYGGQYVEGDPRFLDPAHGDFRLRANSPAIDAGTNDLMLLGTTDWEGQPRIFNGQVDLGADEAVMRCASILPSAGRIETVWEMVVGARCQLQRCTSLPGQAWSTVGQVITNAQPRLTFIDQNPAGPTGFYRVVWLRP